VTVANRQTIDAIEIRTVKLKIYVYGKLTLFVIDNMWHQKSRWSGKRIIGYWTVSRRMHILNLTCNLFSTQIGKTWFYDHIL
jgi:hypothetical protein